MTRLLNANFARLFKGKLFWICAAVSFVFGIIEAIKWAFESDNAFPHPEEALFKSSGLLLLFCETVLVGIFVSMEHGGALRNKIITGKSRAEIFLANTITCSAAAAMLQFIFIAAVLPIGWLSGGFYTLSFGEIALCELLQLVSLIQMCVITSTISLLNQQKFGGTLWSIVLILILWGLGSFVSHEIRQLKYSGWSFFGDALVAMIEEPDITEEERLQISLLESVQDVMPFEQQAQIKDSVYNAIYRVPDDNFQFPDGIPVEGKICTKIPIPVEILPYSLGMIAVTTAVGVLIFRKKDIK